MNLLAIPPMHRLPLMVGLALCGLVGVIAMVRSSGASIRQPDAPTVAMRELVFQDRPDGSVAVVDHQTGRQIDAITGEAGFARGALRGFARDRRARGIGPDAPLQLLARADGRLTLFDPATARIVDLESFGPKNAAVFGQMLGKN
jgi:putative photosynthetic complex assembly protein